MDVIKILIVALLLLAFRIKNYDSRLCFNIFKIVPAEGNFRTIRECGQDDPATETCYKYVHLSQLFLNCLKFLNKKFILKYQQSGFRRKTIRLRLHKGQVILQIHDTNAKLNEMANFSDPYNFLFGNFSCNGSSNLQVALTSLFSFVVLALISPKFLL